MKTVTAAEANRNFSKLLNEAKDGEMIVITSHGEPIAKISPYVPERDNPDEMKRRTNAWRVLRARIDAQPATDIRWKFNRDELYDRE